MLNYYKCYKVFLSGTLLKLMMYLFYPFMVFVWCGLIALGMGVEAIHAKYALLITTGTLTWAELLLDSFVYGGILAKDTNKLEYLKTSCKGMSVLKKSVCVDKLRRLITCALILTAIYSVCNEQVSVGQLISLIFATVAIMEVGLLVIRHFTNFNWIVIFTMIVNAFGIVIGLLAVKLVTIFAVLFLLIFVVVVLISNKIIIKKANKSFYDEEV